MNETSWSGNPGSNFDTSGIYQVTGATSGTQSLGNIQTVDAFAHRTINTSDGVLAFQDISFVGGSATVSLAAAAGSRSHVQEWC